jgi:hypothetical protein
MLYGHAGKTVLEMGGSGPIAWTQQLHNPSHREECDTDLPLHMDWEKPNVEVSLIGIWIESAVELSYTMSVSNSKLIISRIVFK